MTYKTKDGQEIKVGGMYRYTQDVWDGNHTFRCLGYKSSFDDNPVIGIHIYPCGREVADAVSGENHLTSLPESQPEYDPEQMWVVYISHDGKEIIEAARVTTYEYAQQRAKNSFPISAFAIAPVGKKFRKGMNL